MNSRDARAWLASALFLTCYVGGEVIRYLRRKAGFVRRWWYRPTVRDICFHTLYEVHRGFKDLTMTTQQKLDAIATRIETATTNIRSDIAELKAANPTVDFSRLEASVGSLEGLDSENPAPPAPAPTT